MIIFKTTKEIFSACTQGNTVCYEIEAPPKIHLSNNNFIPSINNVQIWEELYYKKNYVGIYAAWSPYVEFYIIVYNFLINTDHGYESFFGPYAARNLTHKANKIGIKLEEKTSWVYEIDYQNFIDT
jgi:hypothetical protein